MVREKVTTRSLQAELSKLKRDNTQLRLQLKQLAEKKEKKPRFSIRKVVIVVCVVVAIFLSIASNLIFWASTTLIDNKSYVEATQPIIENKAVQEAISRLATEELFSQIDVQNITRQALPPEAEFLAPTIANQLRQFTETQTRNILAQDSFQGVWQNVNAKAHERFITGLKNYNGDGTLRIQNVYDVLSARLDDGPLRGLSARQLPERVGSISIISTPYLPLASWFVSNIVWLRIAVLIVSIMLIGLAMYLAQNKRRAAMFIVAGYVFGIVLTLIGLRVIEQLTINSISSDYQSAAQAVWTIISDSLIIQLRASLLLGILLLTGLWITGPSRNAVRVRKKSLLLFQGRLHSLIFSQENGFTLWVKSYKSIITIVITTLMCIMLLIIELTVGNVIIVFGIAVLLYGITQSLAAP